MAHTNEHISYLTRRYLVIFCLLELFFGAVLLLIEHKTRYNYLDHRSNHLMTVADAVLERFAAVSRTVVLEKIQQPEILALMQRAADGNAREREQVREALQQRLQKTFQVLQRENPLRMHFVLPDGTSLLRMHRPDHWGDQLFEVREALRLATERGAEVAGYESGRNDLGAYRFVFPLQREGRLLGLVELSLDDKVFIRFLNRKHEAGTWLMLVRQELVQAKTTIKPDMTNALLHQEYLMIKPDDQRGQSSNSLQLLKQLADSREVVNGLQSGRVFSVPVKQGETQSVATFMPVVNVSGQLEAYKVMVGNAPLLKQLNRNLLVVFPVGSLLLLGIVVLLRRQAVHRISLLEEQETLAAITRAMGEGLLVQDLDGRLLYLNPQAEQLLGYSSTDLTEANVHELIHRHGSDEQGCCPILQTVAADGIYNSQEEKFATANGLLLPVAVHATPLIRSGKQVGVVTLFRDITRQLADQQQIIRMNRLYAALSATNHTIVQAVSREGLFEDICRIAVEAAGFRTAYIALVVDNGSCLRPVAAFGRGVTVGLSDVQMRSVTGGFCLYAEKLLQRQPHICRKRCTIANMAERCGICLGEDQAMVAAYPLICDGQVIAAMIFHAESPDAFDKQQQALLDEMAQDVSFALDTLHRQEQHQQAVDELQRISNFDALTGLPNRTLLLDRLEQAVISAGKEKTQLSLILIGLDRFKVINNSFGHGVGDLVLREVARRLREVVPTGGTLARPGGDEFLVLLPNQDMNDCVHLVTRLLSALAAQAVLVSDQSLTISARAGISLWPADAQDGTTLVKNAYTAMERAKKGDEGSYHFFTADMTAQSMNRLLLENQLRRALCEQQFVLFYQPKVDVGSNAVVGCEALVRWRHPQHGLVGPDQFIPLMEELGLIGQLGEWVLQEACYRMRQWLEGGLPLQGMAVNLSPVQIRNHELVTEIRRILEQSGLAPALLELEITESTAMENVEQTLAMITELRSLGVKIAIDDFGTGYSSLSQLKRLAADTLKIDRSFIQDLPADKDDCAITEAILALASNLGMQVVAEGVETEEQAVFLRQSSCRFIQGYLYSKPLPPDQFELFVRG